MLNRVPTLAEYDQATDADGAASTYPLDPAEVNPLYTTCPRPCGVSGSDHDPLTHHDPLPHVMG